MTEQNSVDGEDGATKNGQQDVGEFTGDSANFVSDDWFAEVGLNKKSVTLLKKECVSTVHVLSLLTGEDIVSLGSPLGQRKLMQEAIDTSFKSDRKEVVQPPLTSASPEDVKVVHTVADVHMVHTAPLATRGGDEAGGGVHSQHVDIQAVRRQAANLKTSDDWAFQLNASLDVEVCLLRGLTYAESTKRTYRTQRDSFLAFCNITGSCPVPASVETVCRYAALLARSLKFSSVRQYLNIIRLLHLEVGEINPLHCYLVQSMLKGLRRQLGDRVIRKLPISPSLLLNILSSLNLDNVLHSAVWAAGLLMFFCMLRRANVLVSSFRCFNVAKHLPCLRRCDISFFPLGCYDYN